MNYIGDIDEDFDLAIVDVAKRHGYKYLHRTYEPLEKKRGITFGRGHEVTPRDAEEEVGEHTSNGMPSE